MQSRGSAVAVLERELSEQRGQASLLPEDPALLLEAAAADIARWQADGHKVITVLDADYPLNLHGVHDRPPVIFVAGRLELGDRRSVAVVGSRRAAAADLKEAQAIAGCLVSAGFVVVSGLAAGIDASAHESTLAAGGRTLAVIGTGLAHCYPTQNADLQRRIAIGGAVISQFWPETPPSRQSFPLRNAVMSGLALGTVVVQASLTSGARVQARLALAHGRPVFLRRALLEQDWARELAARPGVHVFRDPEQITTTLGQLYATDELVE
ncbi:MAG: DNA-processing protein DprA [Solirubrobacteraceae bacterium]